MKNESGFTPNGDLVLILPPPVEEKTAGGLILAKSTQMSEEKATKIGTVLDFGPEAGHHSRMRGVKRGDQVIFNRYAGEFLPVGGVMYLIMAAGQIYGPMTKTPDYQLNAAKSSHEVFGANQTAKVA